MFPLNSNTPYIKDTGERARLGQIVGGGADTPELPDYGVADAGKVLTVGEDGSLEWDKKGAGGGDAFLSYDFTKYGTRTYRSVNYSESGATISTASGYIPIMSNGSRLLNCTIYIDTGDLDIDPVATDHQRTIMGNDSEGMCYEKTNHVWALYGGSWTYSEITDADYFNNCKLKIYIDSDEHWHIYKDEVEIFSSTVAVASNNMFLGSTSQSIPGATFLGCRFYNGNYTET